MPEKITELREKLAELCHSQWNGWMHYLFSKGEFNNDGTWTMPVWAVDRWTRQMRTLYADLPTEEKDTDRKEADKFLEIFKQHSICVKEDAFISDISTLIDEFKAERGLWAEYPDYPRKDWQHEVMDGCTNLGYWKWVEQAIESDAIGARLGKAIVQARKDGE